LSSTETFVHHGHTSNLAHHKGAGQEAGRVLERRRFNSEHHRGGVIESFLKISPNSDVSSCNYIHDILSIYTSFRTYIHTIHNPQPAYESQPAAISTVPLPVYQDVLTGNIIGSVTSILFSFPIINSIRVSANRNVVPGPRLLYISELV
jgi:hypothetical protein